MESNPVISTGSAERLQQKPTSCLIRVPSPKKSAVLKGKESGRLTFILDATYNCGNEEGAPIIYLCVQAENKRRTQKGKRDAVPETPR